MEVIDAVFQAPSGPSSPTLRLCPTCRRGMLLWRPCPYASANATVLGVRSAAEGLLRPRPVALKRAVLTGLTLETGVMTDVDHLKRRKFNGTCDDEYIEWLSDSGKCCGATELLVAAELVSRCIVTVQLANGQWQHLQYDRPSGSSADQKSQQKHPVQHSAPHRADLTHKLLYGTGQTHGPRICSMPKPCSRLRRPQSTWARSL